MSELWQQALQTDQVKTPCYLRLADAQGENELVQKSTSKFSMASMHQDRTCNWHEIRDIGFDPSV
jgi:hypothetical protein